MDVAKYIGLFLHKYQYCYLPNLGNFLVTRKPALQKGDQMEGPQYQVTFTFANGSIDDALANFIATNERISIANAANAIKDFCTDTRESLAEGKEVVIPGFGKFVRNEGKNNFISDQNIEVHTRTIPYFKTQAPVATVSGESISQMYEKMKLKEPTIDEEIVIKPPTVNWSKIIILGLIILAILGAGIGIYWYMSKNNSTYDKPATESAPAASQPATTDTAASAVAAPPAAAASAPANGYTYAILQFVDKAAADKKLEKLKSFGQESYGKDLALKDNGSGVYYITMNVGGSSDTTVVKDSLRKFFNPNGNVFIVK